MNAAAIAMLIAQYGIPLAEKIWLTISAATRDGADPTPEMWAALRALTANTIEQRLTAPPQP